MKEEDPRVLFLSGSPGKYLTPKGSDSNETRSNDEHGRRFGKRTAVAKLRHGKGGACNHERRNK